MKILCFVLFCVGILSILYGLSIAMATSGTLFFLVWFAIGAFSILFSFFLSSGAYFLLPPYFRIAFQCLLLLMSIVFFILFCYVLSGFREGGEKNLDHIIILGAQVRKSGPSIVLKYRLDKAVEYLADNPDTVCIVSGGQGANEPVSEALAMKDYLVLNGISPDRILTEAISTNTVENIRNSMSLIKGEPGRTGIVTNNFHMFRAIKIAASCGLKNPCPIPSASTVYFLPNNIFREILAIIKDLMLANITIG